MQFTDAVMAGRLGAESLAAVAVGGSVWFMGFALVLGVLMAISPIASRHHGAGDEALIVADQELDPARRTVTRGGRTMDLTKTEFDLLELLMMNVGLVLSRSQIYDRIWGYDFGTSSKSLDVYIGYLRRKTEEGGEPRLIQTVRGVGYVLREES